MDRRTFLVLVGASIVAPHTPVPRRVAVLKHADERVRCQGDGIQLEVAACRNRTHRSINRLWNERDGDCGF